ncbi:MAG: GGDEF domain-containing protein [Fibrobacterota bacterium]
MNINLMRGPEIISFLRNRWGVGRFLLITVAALAVSFLYWRSPGFYAWLVGHPSLPWLLATAYGGMFIACFSSYGRIFKFKVFVLGHLYLAVGILYLYLTCFAYPSPDAFYSLAFLKRVDPPTALRVLAGFMSLNLLLIIIAPPSLRYQTTRLIAVLVVGVEITAYFVVLTNISTVAADSVFLYGAGYLVALYLVNLSVVVLSLWLSRREENSFGSAVAALAVVNLLLAHGTASAGLPAAHFTQLLFLLVPLLILGGVFHYWFDCLHHRVAYDPLLKIYNRDYAHNIINGLSRINLGRLFSVAMIDIDRFKAVNDTYGHDMGDQVLHGTAQCIKRMAVPQGVACRYGGEEIIVFFRSMGEKDAYQLCEQIRRSVRKIVYPAGKKDLSVSISIGVAQCDDVRVPLDRVVKAADEAVYQAKETGRNKVVIGNLKKREAYNPRMTNLFIKTTGMDRRQNS